MARTPSLNALRTFHAVAREQSMAAAAAELGVTTGAVSRQIRNLEECVGVALLTRNGRGMRLTADGRALEGELAVAFGQIDAALERLGGPVHGERLRVVVPPMFGAAWLLPRFDLFKAKRPGTEVILVDIERRVGIGNNAEVVISWGRCEESATTFVEHLADSDEIFPVCTPRTLQGDGLAGMTLLHYEGTGKGWSWPGWPEYLEAAGLDGTISTDGPRLTPALLLDALRRGQGVMLANSAIAHDDLAAGRLVRPVPQIMAVEDHYCLLISRTASHLPEVQAFRDWLKQQFAICFGRAQ